MRHVDATSAKPPSKPLGEVKVFFALVKRYGTVVEVLRGTNYI
jgi:hypothetical protein